MTRKFLTIAAAFLLFACGGAETAHDDNHTEKTENHEESNEEHSEEKEEGNGATVIAEVGGYEVYGQNAEVTPDSAMSTQEFSEIFNQADITKNYKVQITLNEVCKKMGCWSNFKIDDEQTMMVFFKDHYTIPIESSEKEAIIYGKIVNDTLTVEFQKHLLDDNKEAGDSVSQEEYDAITEDKIQKNFEAESILLKK